MALGPPSYRVLVWEEIAVYWHFKLLIALSKEIIDTWFRGGSLYKAALRSDTLESTIGILEFLCYSSTILFVLSLFLLPYTLSRS